MSFRHHEKIRKYVVDAVIASLQGEGPDYVEDFESQERSTLFDDLALTSILSFDHPLIRGTIILCCDSDTAAATCPGGAKPGDASSQARLEDWVGELTNLIVGRFKNFMLAHQVRIQLRPPSVSMAPFSTLATYSERMPTQVFWFKVKDLAFCVQLSAEVSDDLDLYTILDRNETVPRPGDVVMTLNEKPKAKAIESGSVAFMNPPAKVAPTKATQSLPQRPNQHERSDGIGDFCGLSWLDGSRIALRFESGTEIRMNVSEIARTGARVISVGGVAIQVQSQAEGLVFQIDGISISLPLAAA